MIYVRMAGGLANQIYQYMGGYALARELGQKLTLDISMCANGFTRGFLLNCFPGIRYDGLIKNTCAGSAGTIDNIDSLKKDFLYGKYVLANNPRCYSFSRSEKDYYICGNWIDKTYWEKYIDEIRKIFYAPEGIDEYVELFRKNDLKKAVGVHIRRGDFVFHGYTKDDDPEYFKGALKFLEKRDPKHEFYVFSDDQEYAKSILGTSSPKIHFISSMPGLIGDVIDFCCLSLCRTKVVSGGSTYSRLAFDLNPEGDKKYIVKNSNDEGFRHRIRNLVSLNSTFKGFECININKKEYSAFAEGYENEADLSGDEDSLKYEEYLKKCRDLYDRKEYEKAEQIAHRIWYHFDYDSGFHELYGDILFKLGRKREAGIEYSAGETGPDGLEKDTKEAVLLYRQREKGNYIIMPDFELKGFTSLKGMILVGILLRRLGNRVSFLINHNDYYSNYLKRSGELMDQDGTGYGCSLHSIRDLNRAGVEALINSLVLESKKNVLLGAEEYRAKGLKYQYMSEEDFRVEGPVEKVDAYRISDVFRIDDRYFDLIENLE